MSAPVVMFSTGRASFVAAVRAREQYEGVRLLFCDTKAEDADNYRFLRESVAALGLPLVTVSDGRTPWEVAHDEHMIPNNRAKLCSRKLKHEPARKWLDANAADALIVLGIGWSEEHRLPGIAAGHAPREVWAPLTEPPYLDGPGLDAVVRSFGMEPPRMYAHGYAHANCAGGCFLAGQAAWRHLLIDSPGAFATHEAEEERFRADRGDYSVLRDRSRKGILTYLGLTEDDIEDVPTGYMDADDEPVTRAQIKATGEWLPNMVPLPLTVLRQRVEADAEESLDLLDWGGCGCTSGDAA